MRQLTPFGILGKGLEDSFVIVWKGSFEKMRVRRRRRRNLTRVYILVVVLVMLIAGVVAANLHSSQPAAENIETESGIQKSGNFEHIMVMGVDRRNDDVGRSDTLMAVTVNKDDETAQILSLPRDTRVQIDGNGYDKINHAYAFGGHNLTRNTVEKLLGVPMDYYVLIDVHAFERIIDALDGVDINVEKRMYYEDPWDDDGGLVIDLYPGMQHMDGKKAIQYVRFRDGEGDIGRIARQQHFMQAVMEKMLSPAVLPKLPTLMEEIRSAVETDMPLSEMLSLAQMLPSIREHGMSSEMVPGSPAYLEDISYWLPDIMKLRQMVASQMNTELADSALESAQVLVKEYEGSLPKGITVMAERTDSTIKPAESDKNNGSADNADKTESEPAKPAKAAGPEGISVLIINDSGINGAAARMADKLRAKGFNVTGVDTGRKSDRPQPIIVTDSSNTDWFYGMPFECTIMDGGEPNEAVIYIGKDYE